MKKTLLSRNIRKLRSFKNMNQTEFAQLFDLNRPTLGAYEEGRSEPKLVTLQKIAQYFHLTIDDLYSKELTINKIAGFNPEDFKKKGTSFHEDRFDAIESRLTSIEAAIRLLAKNKK